MNALLRILIFIIILLIWSAIEQKCLAVTRYSVSSDRLPKNLDGINFVLLADLHDKNFGRNNMRLVKAIDRISPDFILVAGDLVDKNKRAYPGNAYKLLENLAGKYRIYYAYGNHEQTLEQCKKSDRPKEQKLYTSWIEYKERLKKLNVEILDNTAAFYHKNNSRICIYGVTIGEEFFRKHSIPVMKREYMNSLLGNTNNNYFRLLIAHNPEHFREYTRWGADLTVSGHLHGGLMRLPGLGGVISPQVKFFPKYYAGSFKESNKYMIVSRGLGTHSYMPRLFNIPEIVYIKLKADSGSEA